MPRGAGTQIGLIGKTLESVKVRTTPLQRQSAGAVRILALPGLLRSPVFCAASLIRVKDQGGDRPSLWTFPVQQAQVIMSKWSRRLSLFLIIGAILMGPAASIDAGEGDPPPGTYRIINGKLDRGAYAGWFTYHLTCFMCHGVGASGTDIAPDLRLSLKTMTREKFADKVLARYRILGAPGEGAPSDASRDAVRDEALHQRRGPEGRLAMPVWPDESAMKPHILDLYAYLKARSDGAIGAGRPETPDE